MIESFAYTGLPCRILFGEGVLTRLRAEVEALGCSRLLVVSTPRQAAKVTRLIDSVGDCVAGTFAGAEMHTPVAVTERAMAAFAACDADGVLAFGGGTAVGLSKAIAWRNDAPQIVLATTYAGSEATPILGQTADGLKTTLRDARILPEVVFYDPALTLDLPVSTSVTSGMNAIAHAVEALYAPDANPVSSLMAVEGARALLSALPRIADDPTDRAARAEALYGAWLCGTVLGTVGMSLHHKLCHVLGGSFALPHAETHTVILPHALAYNAVAAAGAIVPLAGILGDDPALALHRMAGKLGASTSLAALGMREDDLDRAADLATTNSYPNPRPIERQAIRRLLQRAWTGAPPGAEPL